MWAAALPDVRAHSTAYGVPLAAGEARGVPGEARGVPGEAVAVPAAAVGVRAGAWLLLENPGAA